MDHKSKDIIDGNAALAVNQLRGYVARAKDGNAGAKRNLLQFVISNSKNKVVGVLNLEYVREALDRELALIREGG